MAHWIHWVKATAATLQDRSALGTPQLSNATPTTQTAWLLYLYLLHHPGVMCVFRQRQQLPNGAGSSEHPTKAQHVGDGPSDCGC